MSLDGYIAPDGMDLEHANDPSCQDWLARWMGLRAWTFRQQFFRENLRLGDGGETGRYNDLHEQTYTRTGETILGKRISVDGPATPVATVSDAVVSLSLRQRVAMSWRWSPLWGGWFSAPNAAAARSDLPFHRCGCRSFTTTTVVKEGAPLGTRLGETVTVAGTVQGVGEKRASSPRKPCGSRESPT